MKLYKRQGQMLKNVSSNSVKEARVFLASLLLVVALFETIYNTYVLPRLLIKEINVLLHQAYDSTLDEIYALLKRIDDIENEEVLANKNYF